MTMTWSTTVSRMVWRASSDPLITWAVQVGAGGDAAVAEHNASSSAHPDIRALIAARSLPWTVDVVGAFGPGFDELVPGGAFGALDWGDDYYFYQTPSGENLTAQATEGTTIGCASYLLGAADGYAGDVTQEGVWTLTGGAWVRDTAQPRAGEIVSQDTGAAAWQLGNTYIKCSDGHLEHANLQYLRAIVATATVIETLSGDATLDATTSGAKTGLARCDATSAAFTATLVPAATNRGRSILFVKIDSTGNAVSVDADGSETINGSTSAVTLTSQWDWVRVTSDGTGWVATRGGSGGTVDKLSNVTQDRILGRTSSGSGDSEELTAAQVRSLLGVPTTAEAATAAQGAKADTAVQPARSIAGLDLSVDRTAAALRSALGVYVVGGQGLGTALTDGASMTSARSLLTSTVTTPAIVAGDVLEFTAAVNLLNNSGAARNYTFTLKYGSTNLVVLTITSLTQSATTYPIVVSGHIRANGNNDVSASLQVTGGTGTQTLMRGLHGSSTLEANQTGGLALDLLLTGNATAATQSVQLQSLVVKKLAA